MRASTKRKIRKLISPIRRIGLKNKEFSIISNNCWGGYIYDLFGLQYKTPTIGLYFSSDDYIKFIFNLEHYLSCELIECEPTEKCNVVGKIDDITIYFLHYSSFEIAKTKWNRRKKRINPNNLLVKFNDQNNFNIENLNLFLKSKYKYKIFFGGKDYKYSNKECCILSTSNPRSILNDDMKTFYREYGLNNLKKLLNKMLEEEF